ncbi:MAG: hypothetical protein IJZ44_02775 [Lachnospiraceae bacterium]|nr:hypothetical protein [Lachnospiraceae bacterium]MBQ8230885.1 hypothetical protein [Lachnospiraceae bacterium]
MDGYRVGIFSIDDPGAGIWREMTYLLEQIKRCLDKLIIVCNGEVSTEECHLLLGYADNIYQCIDGYDVNRWQYAIGNFSDDEWSEISELVLFNDSFLGPIYPFETVFLGMDTVDVDFWGITAHGSMPRDRYRNWPRFLQTYFLVFRDKMLHTESFRHFWRKLKKIKNIKEYQEEFEFVFTEYWEARGFTWISYVDTRDLEAEDNTRFMNYLLLCPRELMEKRRLPVLSKYLFQIEREVMLSYHDGSEISRVLQYIDEKTDYDLAYIYEFLLRNHNIYDIYNMLNLNYIVTGNARITCEQKKGKVIVFAHLFYEDLFDYCLEYLGRLPSYVDICITTANESKKRAIEARLDNVGLPNKVMIYAVEARGREWSAFLITGKEIIKNYELACFIHDKKSSQMFYPTVGKCFCDVLWENTIGQGNVEQIIQFFDENKYLGILSAPGVYHGNFFHTSADYWTICYEEVQKLLERLQVTVPMDPDKPPLTIGTAFWCRVSAIRNLFEYPFGYEDFPAEPMAVDGTFNHALERSIAYIAQANGYMTGVVMDSKYAGNDLINKNYIMLHVLRELKKSKHICLSTFYDLMRTMRITFGKREERRKNS